jgi:ABC-type transport system involved in multi-copper enzyme maturation permease subunit
MSTGFRRTVHIAQREWREQFRQPAMLAVINGLFVIVAGLVVLAVAMLQSIADDPATMAHLATILSESGLEPAAAISGTVQSTVLAYNFLIYAQYLGISAVLAGHAILHDRQCGTLTFLLLAPVRRGELLLGKVLGAIGPTTVSYALVNATAGLLITSFSITEPLGTHLPPNPAWWVALLLGGPAWAMWVGAVCVTVSSVARDVRTAQQAVWFVVFFATLLAGFLLTMALPQGAGMQLAAAAVAAFGTAITLLVGAQAISRDLGR